MYSKVRHLIGFGQLLILLCYSNEFILCNNNPEVTLNCGRVRGSLLKTRDGEDILSFRGIPYAEPPVLHNRFKPAIPKQPWSGILDATKDGPICPQNSHKEFNMSEDCLVLNVYTRNLHSSRSVLFYIHGGGLLEGSGRSDLVGPQYLLDHDIVLVTINYRLGILGHIATDNAEVPGNLGFKDQVLALKWVRDNIRNFGGDPNLVTICGWSSGGISVGAQLISPMSKGLFHRAIMMSGSPIELTTPLNYRNTRKVAELIGCPENDGSVECLRYKSVNELLDASKHLSEFGEHPSQKWNVVVEKNFGQERFVVDNPNKLMHTGRFYKLPLMGGWVCGEYALQAYNVFSNSTLLNEFNVDRYRTNPISLIYTRKGERSRNITDTLRDTYINGGNFTMDNIKQLEILLGDANVRFKSRRFLEIASEYEDVYIYAHSYIGRYSHLYYPGNKPYTIAHGDDLQYIFYNEHGISPLLSKADPENAMVEKMTRIWTHFAKEGTPFEDPNGEWSPSNKNRIQVYDLYGDQSKKDYEQYISVWYKLFPEI